MYVEVAFGVTVIEFPTVPPGFHVKVPPGTLAVAVKVAVCPVQMLVPGAVITGVGFTVIAPVAFPGHPPMGVKVTVYNVVAFGEAVKVGPEVPLFQVKVPFITGVTDAVKVAGCPAHTVALVTVTVGEGFTITVVVAEAMHPPMSTVTVYVPAAAAVTFGMVGFCKFDVNPLGPVQV
jgi:hypothetical protein